MITEEQFSSSHGYKKNSTITFKIHIWGQSGEKEQG